MAVTKQQSIKTILYASDQGKHMRPVFRRAIAAAECYKARIVMLHVAEPLTSTGLAVVEAYLPKGQFQQHRQEGMQKILEQMHKRISKFCEDELGASPEDSPLVSDVVVVTGRPGVEIPRQAKLHKAELIVMGTCSHGLLGHGLVGSTARQVIHTSEIPVLVVPNCKKK
jgi:universal stress protein A